MRPFSVFLSLVCLALTGAGSPAVAGNHSETPLTKITPAGQPQAIATASAWVPNPAASATRGHHGHVARTSAEAWFQRMLDAGNPAQALKDPRALLEWLDAISEPRSMTALGSMTVAGAGHAANDQDEQPSPATTHNWAEFIDPRLYLRQMLTGRGSGFQHAIIDAPAGPEKARRKVEVMPATAFPSAGKPAPAPQPGQWFRLNGETVSPAPAAYRY